MSGRTADRILAHVRDQAPLLIRLLRDLVVAESPSAEPAVHDSARHVLIAALLDLGFQAFRIGRKQGPQHIYARPARRVRAAATPPPERR